MAILKKKIGKQGTWPAAIFLLLSPIFIIFAARWVFYEPFVIPSTSMEPTLLINDHIFVNKYAYGIRAPFSEQAWMVNWSTPRRGDVVVFRYPQNPKVFYIKRLIGIPGDKIKVTAGQITVNDEPWVLRSVDQFFGDDGEALTDDSFQYSGESIPDYEAVENFKNSGTLAESAEDLSKLSNEEVQKKIQDKIQNESVSAVERFERLEHFIKRSKNESHLDTEEKEFIVPDNSYFVMGDNRDQSSDSRIWGFVPHDLLIGRAAIIWLSCDKTLDTAPMICDPTKLRLPRFFKKVI